MIDQKNWSEMQLKLINLDFEKGNSQMERKFSLSKVQPRTNAFKLKKVYMRNKKYLLNN